MDSVPDEGKACEVEDAATEFEMNQGIGSGDAGIAPTVGSKGPGRRLRLLVGTEIGQNDELARAQDRSKDALGVGDEGRAIHRARNREGGIDARGSEDWQQRQDRPWLRRVRPAAR